MMEEHQWQRMQTIVDLMYYEQRVQGAFERLLILYSSEKNKADFFLTKAWESCWHRMELIDWLSRMKRGQTKTKGLPKLLYFVSLWVDLPMVWHGLGRWKRCGVDELTFFCIICLLCSFCNYLFIGDLGVSHFGPVLVRAAPHSGGTT